MNQNASTDKNVAVEKNTTNNQQIDHPAYHQGSQGAKKERRNENNNWLGHVHALIRIGTLYYLEIEKYGKL
jgi:hypothetical protein